MHRDIEQAFSLQGRVAVVTGAGSGIGREIACLFAKAGATLVICDLVEAALEETRSSITDIGSQVVDVVADVSDRTAVELLADRACKISGHVDVWVNVAGIIIRKPILETKAAEVDRMIDVNLKSVYWGCAAAGRIMQAQKAGSIINLSSSGADNPVPGLSLYSLTKAGINMLTKSVASEFGPLGIRANAIAPGWIDTPMGNHGFRDETGSINDVKRAEGLAMRAKASPLGLTGEPRDIALTALYLASDASRFITGQIVRPNGGVAMP